MNMKGSNPEVEALSLWNVAFKNWYKLPWLETFILCVTAVIVYVGWLLISLTIEAPPGIEKSTFYISAWVSGLFFVSLGIGFLGTLCGIGGGVLWSPIAMAFTPMDSVVIRASGLIVAMFNGLVASGPLSKSGMLNIRLVLFALIAYGIGAFAGASGAIYVAKMFGPAGEGIIRIILSLIILGLFFYFILGGKKVEYPDVKKEDGFTRLFKIPLPYYEASLGKILNYKLQRGWLLWILVASVGTIGGFFGMGGGWALVPAMNVVMGAPLKVAAAASMSMLGVGDCIAVWPYFLAGAMIPLIIAPLLAGQVVGGILGAYVLVGMRAIFVRFILIGILLFTFFGLFTKGTALLGWFSLPLWVRLGWILVCAAVVFYLIGKEYKWFGSKEGR
jgi:uncharacterized membrane protein YfcA